MLPLPSLDLQAATRRRALYTDSAAFSQALWRQLRTSSGEARLPEDAGRFWSEHSDRAGLDSWTAALGVSKDDRAFLGRWAAKGSADAYVRTALRVVENLQRLAAEKAREAYAGGPDHFGEEHLFRRMQSSLQGRGWEADRALLLADELRTCDYSLQVGGPSLAPAWARARPGPATAQTTAPPSGAPGGAGQESEDEDDEQGMLAKPLPEDEEVPWGYVISITRGGRHRKLHNVGSCRLIPGLDYKEYEVWGARLPPSSELNSRCGNCFGSSALAPVEEASDVASVTSSSETSGEEPAEEKDPLP